MTGRVGTLIILLGVLVSASLQLLSIWIVFNFFLDKDDKYKLGDLRDWRVLYGHNIDYLDSAAGSSLVAKMCKGGLVDRVWWQFQLLDEVNKYLHPLFPGADGLGVGVVLSSIALTIWIFSITAELKSIWDFAWSIWRLPCRETLVNTVSPEDRVLQSISCGRLGMLTVMLMVRTGIAVMLGVAGARWLAVTPDVKDILLNAVALLFILEIDELLYKVQRTNNQQKQSSHSNQLTLQDSFKSFFLALPTEFPAGAGAQARHQAHVFVSRAPTWRPKDLGRSANFHLINSCLQSTLRSCFTRRCPIAYSCTCFLKAVFAVVCLDGYAKDLMALLPKIASISRSGCLLHSETLHADPFPRPVHRAQRRPQCQGSPAG